MTDQVLPKIKIPLTLTDKIIEAVGLLALCFFWFFTLSHFNPLPDIIPTHFGANGEPDGYGKKWLILTLPGIGTLIYIGLTLVSQFPHKLNYAITITQANAEKQYAIVARMFRIIKITLLVVFFLLAYHTIQLVSGLPDLFGRWFLLIVFALVFAPIFYFLIQSSKNA